MSWQKTVNSRGRKVPFTGKSLFQIGKDLRPTIDRVIMRQSLVPGTALLDKAAFPVDQRTGAPLGGDPRRGASNPRRGHPLAR